MTDNRTGGEQNAAQESPWIHVVFTGGDATLREDGEKTMLNPNTQKSLRGAAQNFQKYVKVTERGYEALQTIPKDTAIGYLKGPLTKEDPRVFQSIGIGNAHSQNHKFV